MRVVLETYTFLYSRQNNNYYSLKKFDFLKQDKQIETDEY